METPLPFLRPAYGILHQKIRNATADLLNDGVPDT
jgi:hypothetical protein